MTDWPTYRVSDLLLFSPRVFYRLFELVNTSAWPAHIVTLMLGLALLWVLMFPTVTRMRVASVLLAIVWVWIAWFYLARHYVTINWAAAWIIPLFLIEGAVIALAGLFGTWRNVAGSPRRFFNASVLLLAALVVAYPLLAPLVGRPWLQMEVFGIAPDPTSLVTLAWLAGGDLKYRWLLMIVPVLWCALSGLTLWVLDDPLFWLPPVMAIAILVVGRGRRRGAPDPHHTT